jgi:hypothetical protein
MNDLIELLQKRANEWNEHVRFEKWQPGVYFKEITDITPLYVTFRVIFNDWKYEYHVEEITLTLDELFDDGKLIEFGQQEKQKKEELILESIKNANKLREIEDHKQYERLKTRFGA